MQKRITAALIAALGLIGGVAGADERGVQLKNTDAADLIVSVQDGNDGDRLILDQYQINHGETYSVAPAFGADHSYDLKWHAERTTDHKSTDGECVGQDTPCEISLWNVK